MFTQIMNRLRSFNRKIFFDTLLMRSLGRLASVYIRLCLATGKWRYDIDPESNRRMQEKIPSVFLFWHGRLMMMSVAKPQALRVEMLMTLNKAGLMTEAMTKPFNIGSVRGSAFNPKKPEKDKGGVRALKSLIRTLRAGVSVGFTPDGPRGPARQMTEGAVFTAKLSGAALIPVSFSAKRALALNGWDRFMIPLPFSPGVIKIGAPIFVPYEISQEEAEAVRLQTEQALNDLTDQADAECGRS